MEVNHDLEDDGQNLPDFKMKNGWVIFDVTECAAALTEEALNAYESSEIEDEYQRAVFPERDP